MNFGNILYELREDKFLTKTQLAKILQVTRQQISKYENGSSIPSGDVLMRAADYFCVTTDYLLGRGESSESPNSKKKHLTVPEELTEDDVEIVEGVIRALQRQRIKTFKSVRLVKN